MEDDEMSAYLMVSGSRRLKDLSIPSPLQAPPSPLGPSNSTTSHSAWPPGLPPHPLTPPPALPLRAPEQDDSHAHAHAHAVLVLLPDGSARLYESPLLTAADVLAEFPRHTISLLPSRRPSASLLPQTSLLPHNTYYLHAAAGAASEMPPLPSTVSGTLHPRPPRRLGGSSQFPVGAWSIEKGWDEGQGDPEEGEEEQQEDEEEVREEQKSEGTGPYEQPRVRRHGVSCQFPVQGRASRTPSPGFPMQEPSSIISFNRVPRMQRSSANSGDFPVHPQRTPVKAMHHLPPRSCSSTSTSAELDFPVELLLQPSGDITQPLRAHRAPPGAPDTPLSVLLSRSKTSHTRSDFPFAHLHQPPHSRAATIARIGAMPVPAGNQCQVSTGVEQAGTTSPAQATGGTLCLGDPGQETSQKGGGRGQGLSRSSSLASSLSFGLEEAEESVSCQAGNAILQELEMLEKADTECLKSESELSGTCKPSEHQEPAKPATMTAQARLTASLLKKGPPTSSSSGGGGLLAGISSLAFKRSRAQGKEATPKAAQNSKGKQQAWDVDGAHGSAEQVKPEAELKGRLLFSKVVGSRSRGLQEAWNSISVPQSCAPVLHAAT